MPSMPPAVRRRGTAALVSHTKPMSVFRAPPPRRPYTRVSGEAIHGQIHKRRQARPRGSGGRQRAREVGGVSRGNCAAGAVQRHGRRQALKDAVQDRPVIFDALEIPVEKVSHVKPVLLVKRTVEMELLAKHFLHLRGDLRIELAPRIRTAGSEGDHEK